MHGSKDAAAGSPSSTEESYASLLTAGAMVWSLKPFFELELISRSLKLKPFFGARIFTLPRRWHQPDIGG
jgi:hypothetical protein